MSRDPASVLLLFGIFGSPAFSQEYFAYTVAGGGQPPSFVRATEVPIGSPERLAADSQGNVYFTSGFTLFKVTPKGTLIRLAGNGYKRALPPDGVAAPLPGNGDAAANAQLSSVYPQGVAADGSGNVLIVDNQHVRKITNDGNIQDLAGTGRATNNGDGGPALAASIRPQEIAADKGGNLYISSVCAIRRVTPDGRIATVAGTIATGSLDPRGLVQGNTVCGSAGDGGAATSALIQPSYITSTPSGGTLYLTAGPTIRKVDRSGVISTVAGSGEIAGLSTPVESSDQPALNVSISVTALAADDRGDVFFVDRGVIRQLTASGLVRTLTFPGNKNITAVAASYTTPPVVFFSRRTQDGRPDGQVLLLDNDGQVTLLAGNGLPVSSGDGGPATSARLARPQGVAVLNDGSIVISDTDNNTIRKVDPFGFISTIAGTSKPGFSGDDGPALDASLSSPTSIVADSQGVLYFTDRANYRVRRIDQAGIITTFAGTGTQGFSGDGGPAVSSDISGGVAAIDKNGCVYILGGGRLRTICQDGIIKTIAGNGPVATGSGDGALATEATLDPASTSVAIDSKGLVYIGSWTSIRRIDESGVITTIKECACALLSFDREGNLFSTFVGLGSVVSVFLADGTSRTVAGSGYPGYAGDNSPALKASFMTIRDMTTDNVGNIYLLDDRSGAVRIMVPVR